MVASQEDWDKMLKYLAMKNLTLSREDDSG